MPEFSIGEYRRDLMGEDGRFGGIGGEDVHRGRSLATTEHEPWTGNPS